VCVHTGGSTGVHEYGTGIGLGRCRWVGLGITRRTEFVKGHNCHTLGSLGHFDCFVGRYQIVRVDNVLERGHTGTLLGQPGYILTVANDNGYDIVDDSFGNGVHPERRVDGGHGDALRKGAHGGDHPFGTGVFENSDPTGRRDLLQSRRVGRRLHSRRSEGGTELIGLLTDLSVGLPRGVGTEFLDFGRPPTEKVANAHAVAGSESLKGDLGDIVQSIHTRTRCSNELCPKAGVDTVRFIVGHGDGPQLVGRGNLSNDS